MPLFAFELGCIPIVLITLAMMLTLRRHAARELLPMYGALAIAGLLGEASCVAWYRHYEYHAPWHARVLDVPLLVPLIWPLVILSARDVVTALWPRAARVTRAVLVGALVVFDASLVEVVAVRAGLWRWSEPGHLGVPIIGIVGWGYFAAVAEAVCGMRARRDWHTWLAIIVIAPLGTHALIQLSWWSMFRWIWRGDLDGKSVLVVMLLGAAATALAWHLRRARRLIPLEIALPRMVAATLFVALLITTAPRDLYLWLHVIAVAVPYLVATSFTGKDSPAAPRATTAPSPPETR